MSQPPSKGRAERLAAGAAVLLWLLGACTRSSDEQRADREARADGAANRAATTTSPPVASLATDVDMVSAVSNASSKTPIDLKFRLADRPQIGQPLTVELLLVPDAAARVTKVHLAFQGGDGLLLQSPADVDLEPIGASARQQLTVQPQTAGVLNLSVTAVVDTEATSIARTYSIPVIAAASSTP